MKPSSKQRVIDCTPEGMANKHKQEWYNNLLQHRALWLKEANLGLREVYARGINDAAFQPGVDRFIQVAVVTP